MLIDRRIPLVHILGRNDVFVGTDCDMAEAAAPETVEPKARSRRKPKPDQHG